MVLVGILVGYVIALFIVGTSKEPLRSWRVMTNMFLVGIVLGIVFALVYIFVF
jgi:MFS family permease